MLELPELLLEPLDLPELLLEPLDLPELLLEPEPQLEPLPQEPQSSDYRQTNPPP